MTVPLSRARAKLGEKEKSLLIIDEVFDYLDDANLLVAQHFLLELMKQFKDAGKSIYVVILTHRDPSQFKSFRFKKLHASYISPVENGAEKGCLHKIPVDRRRCQREQQHIYEAVSSHYLHFSDCQAAPQDVRAYVAQQMIGNAPKEPASFRNEMESRLGDYFSEKPFSSSEVCCGSPAPPLPRTDYRSVSSFGSLRALFVLKLVSEEVCSLRLGIFHAWSLKIMLMVGDYVFFIPRRIRLSICERDIALPTEVRIACAVVSF